MTTQKKTIKGFFISSCLLLLIVAPLALAMVGCAKKCPVSLEKQTSVTATEWRLVESTDPDPDIQDNLSLFTFLVFRFGQDFSGDIKLVLNNTQYDQPVRTFIYDVDPNSKQLEIKYAFSQGQGGQDSNAGNNQNGGDSPIFYSYELGRSLELTSDQGYYYRFVPFTGILAPDETCTF